MSAVTPLTDRHGRSKGKLRISVTDRCNFRCPYCMPETPQWLPRDALLSFEELERIAGIFVRRLGIHSVRITGGEPLLRKDLPLLISSLGGLRAAGLQRISMTSNGLLLSRQAQALATAGLDDVNISLDTLDHERFKQMSGGRGDVDAVLAGIRAARAAGLPVKLNCVVIRGHNEADLLPLARWAHAEHLSLRFIEFMPLDDGHGWSRGRVVSEAEILATLRSEFEFVPLVSGHNPANEYALADGYSFGIIPTISNPFCTSCDRVRLTASGSLYACLFSASGRDLRTAMRAGANDAELEHIVRGHVWHKEAGYAQRQGYVERPISMHALGG